MGRLIAILAGSILTGVMIKLMWGFNMGPVAGLMLVAAAFTMLQNNPAYAPGFRGMWRFGVALLVAAVALFAYGIGVFLIGKLVGIDMSMFVHQWGTHGGSMGILNGRGTHEELSAVYFALFCTLGALLLVVVALFNPARGRKIGISLATVVMVLLAGLIISPKAVDLVGRLAKSSAAASDPMAELEKSAERTEDHGEMLRITRQMRHAKRQLLRDERTQLEASHFPCPANPAEKCWPPGTAEKIQQIAWDLEHLHLTKEGDVQIRGDQGFALTATRVTQGQRIRVLHTDGEVTVFRSDINGFVKKWVSYVTNFFRHASGGQLVWMALLVGFGCTFVGLGIWLCYKKKSWKPVWLIPAGLGLLCCTQWVVDKSDINIAHVTPGGVQGGTCKHFRDRAAEDGQLESGEQCLLPDAPMGALTLCVIPDGKERNVDVARKTGTCKVVGNVALQGDYAQGLVVNVDTLGFEKTTGKPLSGQVVAVVNHWSYGDTELRGAFTISLMRDPTTPAAKARPVAPRLVGETCESNDDCASNTCVEGKCSKTLTFDTVIEARSAGEGDDVID